MTTQESIDKFLTEKLFGECWHEYKPSTAEAVAEICFGGTVRCSKCGERNFERNTPFSSTPWNKTIHSPDGFFRLWEKMQEREDWSAFCVAYSLDEGQNWERIINHQTFPRLVAEWLGWKENK